MDKNIIESKLNELSAPCEIYTFDEIASTNTLAKEMAREGAKSFTLITADKQSAGRGRMGRSFFSPDGSGIYLSLIIRPRFTFEEAFLITPSVAVAITNVLEKYGIDAKIKWVNDIYVNSRKVCGILTETCFSNDGITEWAVIGIGINLLKPKNNFPEEIQNIAGYLFENENDYISREMFTAEIITSVINAYKSLPDTNFIKSYQSKSFLDNKYVILQNGETVQVVGIDDRCGLIVKHSDEKIETLTSTDVTIKITDSPD